MFRKISLACLAGAAIVASLVGFPLIGLALIGLTLGSILLEADIDATGLGFAGNDLDFLTSGRARLGYAFNHWLPYATGGIAYAKAGNLSDTGWIAGGGVDWAVTDHIVPGVEYLHYGFGNFDHTGVDASADVVRARLNFKF